MKLCPYLFFLIFSIQFLNAQSNRLPYIQASTDSSTIVAWRTANLEASELHWGTDQNNLDQVLLENTPKRKHFFELTGLQAGTVYYYEVVSAALNAGINNFQTARPDLQAPFSFLHYGDCGYDNSQQNTIATLMEMENVDFGIVSGDIDQGFGDNYDQVYFGVYEDMLKTDCHYTSIGNHDTYADGAATYLDEFYLLNNNPQQSERYYSFYWGNAKFICLDSNLPYVNGTIQYNWLIDEMQCNDREWLFVFFHHPPWTNAWSLDYYIPFTPFFQYEGNEDMRNSLVPVFEQYSVDFVLNGHAHCYQTGELNGVRYVISGGAGASTIDINTNSDSPNIDTELYINQYVRFDMDGDTARYVCIDISGNVVDEVTVTKSFAPFSAVVSTNNATCDAGGSNGTASIQVSGSFAPYSYLWPNGSDGLSVSNLGAGTYSVEITDSRGCVKTESFSIGLTGDLTVTPVQLNATCVNSSNGIAGVNVTGAGNYSYIWSNGATQSSIAGLSPGEYSVTVSSSSGCSSIQSFEILYDNIVEPGIASSTGVFNFCENETITLSTDQPYTGYLWSNGETTAQIQVNSAGDYSVTVTNPIGCEGYSQTIPVEQFFPPSLTTTNTNAECINSADGSATVVASGGSGNYFYQWSNGLTTSMITGLSAGSYEVTVFDSNGCIAVSDTEVEYTLELPEADFILNSNELSIEVDATNSLNASTYSWDFGDNTTGSGVMTNHTYADQGIYTITLTVTNACGEDSFETMVAVMTTSVSSAGHSDFEVSVQPNPFRETAEFHFSNPGNETFTLELFGEDGKRVKTYEQISGERKKINANGIPAGIYFYQLSTERKKAIGKVTIQ